MTRRTAARRRCSPARRRRERRAGRRRAAPGAGRTRRRPAPLRAGPPRRTRSSPRRQARAGPGTPGRSRGRRVGQPVVEVVEVDGSRPAGRPRGEVGRRRCADAGGERPGGVPGPRGRRCRRSGARVDGHGAAGRRRRRRRRRPGAGPRRARAAPAGPAGSVPRRWRSRPASPARSASSTKRGAGHEHGAGDGVVGQPRVGAEGQPAGEHGAVAVGERDRRAEQRVAGARPARRRSASPRSAGRVQPVALRAGRRRWAGRRAGAGAGEDGRPVDRSTPRGARLRQRRRACAAASSRSRRSARRATVGVLGAVAAAMRGQHRVRADLQEPGHAPRRQRGHRVGEPDRRRGPAAPSTRRRDTARRSASSPVTFDTTGIVGGSRRSPRRATRANSASIGSISGEWNAWLTPRSRASCTPAPPPPPRPASTSAVAGDHHRRAARSPPRRDTRPVSRERTSRLRRAAPPPSPHRPAAPASAGPAPRPAPHASASDNTPATCAAAISPIECPATKSGVTPHDSSSRNSATSTANSAGWVHPRLDPARRPRSAKITSRSDRPAAASNAAHTSSNAAANTGNAAAQLPAHPHPLRALTGEQQREPPVRPVTTPRRAAAGQRGQPASRPATVRRRAPPPGAPALPAGRPASTPTSAGRTSGAVEAVRAAGRACPRSAAADRPESSQRHAPAACGGRVRRDGPRRGGACSRITCALVPLIPNDGHAGPARPAVLAATAGPR